MSKTLSVIVTGRNDSHQGDFLNRLEHSIRENCKLLEAHFRLDFEYVVVDWCSSVPLSETMIGQISSNVVFIEVEEENIKGRWKTLRFHQFFAKNIGIRHCNGSWILLINADNILNESLIKRMESVILKNNHAEFYRTKWWKNSDGKKIDCTICAPIERGLAPVYSGDFLFASKVALIEKGKGYDESNIHHQTEKPQAQMDGEILFNLKKNGVKPVIWDEEIYHIDHTRGGIYDKEYNRKGYNNLTNWGCSDLSKKEIKQRVFKLEKSSNTKIERIPKNFFMAWGGSEPPAWCKKAFDEYKATLGPHWNCQLFRSLDVPETYRLYQEQKKLPFFTYKSDIFRIWLLEEFGGFWVDTDTRIIRPFDDLIFYEGVATVHRDSPQSPLDGFHTDSCLIGSMPNGRMLDLVIEKVYEDISKKGYQQFTWNFYHPMTPNCPPYVHIGPFDEIATDAERKEFMDCDFDKITPKRDNSYIRHYLTHLYKNQEGI